MSSLLVEQTTHAQVMDVYFRYIVCYRYFQVETSLSTTEIGSSGKALESQHIMCFKNS